jgi:c(7)-type cytochrome triheme protein
VRGPRRVALPLVLLVLALLAGARAVAAQPKGPPDFGMPKAESSPGFVTFSHERHRAKVPACATCHARDFKMKRGASGPITLEAKQQGKLCGACHDGKAAFPIEQCDSCHKDTPVAGAPAPPPGKEPGTVAQAPEGPGAECLACHGDKDLKRSARRKEPATSVFVDAASFQSSTHASLDCVGCHTTATVPHGALPRVRCTDCHGEVPDVVGASVHARPKPQEAPSCAGCHGVHDVRPAKSPDVEKCAACHGAQVARYRESIHGASRQKGDLEAATCSSCHGATHAIVTTSDPRAPTYHLNLPRTCAKCHADPELARRHGIEAGDVYQQYMDSIHGRAVTRAGLLVAANCSDCHTAHAIKPKNDPKSSVFRDNIPRTCAGCHAGIHATYAQSIHGAAVARGNPIAPVCTDCHTAHRIRRVEAEAWKLDIIAECGTCHAESLRTYRDTFHGKVTALGFTRVARCSDCHGSHAVRPARDPASQVHPANLVQTCARCHPRANQNFVQYDPHADPDDPTRDRLLYWTAFFMRWLLVGTFTFFGIHTVLWGVRGLVQGRRSPRAPRDD